MPDLLSSEVAARLARMESTIKRDRIVAIAAIAFVFFGARAIAQSSAGQTTPVTVQDASGASATLSASGLTVRDTTGKERAFYGLDDGGRPDIDLSDSAGNLRESIYLLDGSPIIRFFDTNGKRRLDLAMDSAGAGLIDFLDENEKIRMSMFRTHGGDPQLGLYGSDEKLRAYFSTDDSSPYLVMRDANQVNRITIGGYSDGSVGLDLRDASNAVLWKAP